MKLISKIEDEIILFVTIFLFVITLNLFSFYSHSIIFPYTILPTFGEYEIPNPFITTISAINTRETEELEAFTHILLE
jgi:hypothetical protein